MSLEVETQNTFLHSGVGSMGDFEDDDDFDGLAEFLEAEVLSVGDDPPTTSEELKTKSNDHTQVTRKVCLSRELRLPFFIPGPVDVLLGRSVPIIMDRPDGLVDKTPKTCDALSTYLSSSPRQWRVFSSNPCFLETVAQVCKDLTVYQDCIAARHLNSRAVGLPSDVYPEVDQGNLYPWEPHLGENCYLRNVVDGAEESGDALYGIYTGNFGKIPPELFPNILKFLSSEDLSMCASVCQFLRVATSDESLWRRLYCLRWGPPAQSNRKGKPRGTAWKQLYFERDHADMVEFVRNTPAEFREYYIQMQAAKRSQAPAPSQVRDDLVVIDTTVADHITAWKRSQKLPDVYVGDHWCSGRTCSYNQIGDIFLCEKTGRAHVCDDTCRETVLDPSNELLVCTVSGRCFDRWLDGDDEEDETTTSRQQAESIAAAEEGETYLNAGRLGRAYLLGYNCEDEKELDAALRSQEVVYPGSKKQKLFLACCDWQRN